MRILLLFLALHSLSANAEKGTFGPAAKAKPSCTVESKVDQRNGLYDFSFGSTCLNIMKSVREFKDTSLNKCKYNLACQFVNTVNEDVQAPFIETIKKIKNAELELNSIQKLQVEISKSDGCGSAQNETKKLNEKILTKAKNAYSLLTYKAAAKRENNIMISEKQAIAIGKIREKREGYTGIIAFVSNKYPPSTAECPSEDSANQKLDRVLGDYKIVVAKTRELEQKADGYIKDAEKAIATTKGVIKDCKPITKADAPADKKQETDATATDKAKAASDDEAKKKKAEEEAAAAAKKEADAKKVTTTTDKQKWQEETNMVIASQKDTSAKAQAQHYAELQKFADEQGLKLPAGCLRGAYGSCANHIAAMRQLYYSNNQSLYEDYAAELKSNKVKVGIKQFTVLNGTPSSN